PFRLGDSICLEVQASQACQLVLLDIGTSGAVAVVLPNQWHVDFRLEPQRLYSVPGPLGGEFELTLQGPRGYERVLALGFEKVATVTLNPQRGDVFRLLGNAEVQLLVDAARQLPAQTWAAAACEFEVTDG